MKSQILIAEGMNSAVGYRLPSFAVDFLDYTLSFQQFCSFMEIFLKQIIFLKLTLSVLLLVLWWPEVLLTAIISSLSNPMEALKVERKIYGLDTAQKFLSGVKTEVRVDNYKGPFQSLLKSNREASSAKYSLSCLRYVFSAISLKKICL